MSNVNDLFQNQRNKIASMFLREEEIIQKSQWMKSFEEDSDIEKSEGARGGKVIGHTKSGKPIYDSPDHEGHRNYTAEDHDDAATHHFKESNKHHFQAEREYLHLSQKESNTTTTEQESIDKHRKISEHHTKMGRLHSQASDEKKTKSSTDTQKKHRSEVEKLVDTASEHLSSGTHPSHGREQLEKNKEKLHKHLDKLHKDGATEKDVKEHVNKVVGKTIGEYDDEDGGHGQWFHEDKGLVHKIVKDYYKNKKTTDK